MSSEIEISSLTQLDSLHISFLTAVFEICNITRMLGHLTTSMGAAAQAQDIALHYTIEA